MPENEFAVRRTLFGAFKRDNGIRHIAPTTNKKKQRRQSALEKGNNGNGIEGGMQINQITRRLGPSIFLWKQIGGVLSVRDVHLHIKRTFFKQQNQIVR